MVLPKLNRHLNEKNTWSDRGSIHEHQNLNHTERSVIAHYRNFNAPKICKITVLFSTNFSPIRQETTKLEKFKVSGLQKKMRHRHCKKKPVWRHERFHASLWMAPNGIKDRASFLQAWTHRRRTENSPKWPREGIWRFIFLKLASLMWSIYLFHTKRNFLCHCHTKEKLSLSLSHKRETFFVIVTQNRNHFCHCQTKEKLSLSLSHKTETFFVIVTQKRNFLCHRPTKQKLSLSSSHKREIFWENQKPPTCL